MKTVILTGGIGSGKSCVADCFRSLGVPVYDSDSRTKALYDSNPSLVDELEKALDCPLRRADGVFDRAALAARIFPDPSARVLVEKTVYPFVMKDFLSWRESSRAAWVVLESAVILQKPEFAALGDLFILVDAPVEKRIGRVMERDGISREKVLERMKQQDVGPDSRKWDWIIENTSSKEALMARTRRIFDEIDYICRIETKEKQNMKTDLAKILSIRGQHGLFRYVAQSRTGAVAEALDGGKRSNFAASSGITTLEDISIYTDEGEVKLRDVFGKMHEVLADAPAPDSKSDPKVLEAFFAKALPSYDANRFYVSHMRKVVEWYNALKNFASLEFLTDEEREAEANA